MPGKPDSHLSRLAPAPVAHAGRPVPAPQLHSIIGKPPRRQNRPPPPPSISRSIRAPQYGNLHRRIPFAHIAPLSAPIGPIRRQRRPPPSGTIFRISAKEKPEKQSSASGHPAWTRNTRGSSMTTTASQVRPGSRNDEVFLGLWDRRPP
jgi:hypothetical protein